MKIVKTICEVREQVSTWKKEGLSIGFVPTMGYLHEGHGSLIKEANKNNDKVVVSIFVNPIQFGPKEDLASYPRDLEKDTILCTECGADLIFAPEVTEMYPNGEIITSVNVSNISEGLCGSKRPGHFQGVCTVVSKLFNIVAPDRAYFGEKDAQQLAVIKNMVKELNFPIEITGCPIVREDDGLAKSSRNTYLNEEERKAALVLNKSLKLAKERFDSGINSASIIKIHIEDFINKEPLATIDYVEIVDSLTMESVTIIGENTMIALAVFIGKTRLIDNIIF